MERRNSSQYWLSSALVMLSLLLLICALWQPKSRTVEKWLPVNRQLKATLAVLAAPADEQGSSSKSGTVNRGAAAAVRIDGKGAASARSAAQNSANNADTILKKGTGEIESDSGKKVRDTGETKEKLPSVAAATAKNAGKIDVNRATMEELDTLPGVGAAKAKAIVDYRELNGPFRTVDDLEKVKGIGPKMIEEMKDEIVAVP